MADKPTPNLRRGDRRVRQVYHDVERRDGTDRRRQSDEPVVRREKTEFALLPLLAIAEVALFLIDTFVFHGAYVHAFRVSLSADVVSTRAWADRAWY